MLLLDEATAALEYEQTRQVEHLIRKLSKQGTAVVVVSHDLPLCYEVTHRIGHPQPRTQGRRRPNSRSRP